jgi:hypothetical protein
MRSEGLIWTSKSNLQLIKTDRLGRGEASVFGTTAENHLEVVTRLVLEVLPLNFVSFVVTRARATIDGSYSGVCTPRIAKLPSVK